MESYLYFFTATFVVTVFNVAVVPEKLLDRFF
jgi:hypothetical protein